MRRFVPHSGPKAGGQSLEATKVKRERRKEK